MWKVLGAARFCRAMGFLGTLLVTFCWPSPALAACQPDCSGKVCGDDGCGGNCGECSGGVCLDGGCLTDCSVVPEVGCCTGNSLLFCVGTTVFLGNCGQSSACGWSQTWDGYACGTSGGSDPTGTFPKECAIDCKATCLPNGCGLDGCGGSCGECQPGDVCVEGQCCTPQCGNATCGEDGCGGSCGSCPGEMKCYQGVCCVPDCEGKVCGSDGCGGICGPCWGVCLEGTCVSGCSGVSSVGCCFEGNAFFCGLKELVEEGCDGDSPCGWVPYYGYTCGGDGAVDPSGVYAKECVFDCSKNCGPGSCGSDGCGGSCGDCKVGETCLFGHCCVPDCVGKECGSDGCDGECGHCAGTFDQVECSEGKCVPAWGCVDTLVTGCAGCACEECVCGILPECCVEEWSTSCSSLCEGGCGGCSACVPSCAGKMCGTDGCGGSCGICDAGFQCIEGDCCKKQCEGKTCGPDGCGGTCGLCEPGEVCEGGTTCVQKHGCEVTDTPKCGGCKCQSCVCSIDFYCCYTEWDFTCLMECESECGGCGEKTCAPNCEGRECGPDGCGGQCGECPGQVCYQGTCCSPTCAPDASCGSDGCGGTCGPECDLGSRCIDGKCESHCYTECAERQCGSGDCGGYCSPKGYCPGSQRCIEGKCLGLAVPIPEDVGCCVGDTLFQKTCLHPPFGVGCDIGATNCLFAGGYQCGWYEEYDYVSGEWIGWYDCFGGGADPSGSYPKECDLTCRAPHCGEDNECGPDGCGGFCSTCELGSRCVKGHCIETQCEGRECGPDGTGGLCGTCPSGSRCDEQYRCVVCQNPCDGKSCGPDGCGGYCGSCEEDSVCVDGVCISDPDLIDEAGCCYGDNILLFEFYGGFGRVKCSPGWNSCGWNAQSNRYSCDTDGGEDPLGVHPRDCLANCIHQCADRECGPGGCGNSCGSCPDGMECSESGTCYQAPLEPVIEHVEAEPSDVRDTSHDEIVNPDPEQAGPSDLGRIDGSSGELDTAKSSGGCAVARSESSTPHYILMAVLFLVVLGLRLSGKVVRRRKA